MSVPSGATQFPGSRHPPQRAGFVELLFDVVLVFALTRLTEGLYEHLTWWGFYTALVQTLAVWWLWYRTAWMANRYDPTRPMIKIIIILTMLGALLMAAALPLAFGDRAAVFATVYVGVHVFRNVCLVLFGGGGGHRLVSLRLLFWACVSAVPWIGGIFTDQDTRLALWTVAILIDYAAGLLDFPTPRLGRAGLRGLPIGEEHLTERYRQLLVIAFGETILAAGAQLSQYGFERDRTAALVVAFVTTVLFWQIYYYRAGELLPAAIASSRAPAYVGERASYAHLIMVVGISVTSVGDKLSIVHPSGKTATSWALVFFGGPALFLVGRGMLDYVCFSRISRSRLIGVLVLVALVPVSVVLMSPLLAAVAATVVVAGVAASNAISWRLFPREMAPPPGHQGRDAGWS